MTKTICDICQREEGPFQRVETQVGIHPHAGSIITRNLDFCPECLKATALRSKESLEELKHKLEASKKKSRPEILANSSLKKWKSSMKKAKKRPYIIRANFIRRPGRKPKVRVLVMTDEGRRQHTQELPRRDTLKEYKALLLNEYRRRKS